MTSTKGKRFWKRNFWIRETLSGDTEYRTSSKALFTILLLLLPALLYKLLIAIEGLEGGGDIIVVLAYGIGVLLISLILLVLIISLVEYLRKFE